MTDCDSLERRNDLDSPGMEPWECLPVSGNSSGACLSDWRSVLRLVAFMSDSPEFPHTGNPDSWLRMQISRVDISNVGRNCAKDFSTRKMCPRVQMPEIGCLLRHCLLFRFGWSCRFGRSLPAREELSAEDWGYIWQLADGESPFCVRPVIGSHLFGSSIGRVLLAAAATCLSDTCRGRYLVISVSPVFCIGEA